VCTHRRHGITDERAALYAAVGDWLGAVGPRDFHGGGAPDLADLAVFGVLRSVEGLDTFGDTMANTEVAAWYDRMRSAVGPPARVEITAEPAPDFRAEVRKVVK
jgi:microsomal prostaglandin-E synthase 2